MNAVEFNADWQSRPARKQVVDMSSRVPAYPMGYISGVMLQASYSTLELTNNYTAAGKTLILADASNGVITVTLPASSSSMGKFYTIKKVDSSSNSLIIVPNTDTELIDGENSLTLSLQYQYVILCCSGSISGDSYWHVIGGEYVKMEEILESRLDTVADVLDKLLIEVRQSKLHLASMSNESISEEDADE